MIDHEEALREAIERLRPRYRATMTEFKARLDAAFLLAGQSSRDPAGLEEARFVAHRLAGTAAHFGWPELGEQAMAVETVLADGLAGRCPRPLALRHIRDLAQALEVSLQA